MSKAKKQKRRHDRPDAQIILQYPVAAPPPPPLAPLFPAIPAQNQRETGRRGGSALGVGDYVVRGVNNGSRGAADTANAPGCVDEK